MLFFSVAERFTVVFSYVKSIPVLGATMFTQIKDILHTCFEHDHCICTPMDIQKHTKMHLCLDVVWCGTKCRLMSVRCTIVQAGVMLRTMSRLRPVDHMDQSR